MDPNDRLPILPHEFVGAADCCGCLVVDVRGERAEILCNECGAVIRTVPATEAKGAFLELAREFAPSEFCTATCPDCGAVRTFPGFSSIEAFVCEECGAGIVIRPTEQ